MTDTESIAEIRERHDLMESEIEQISCGQDGQDAHDDRSELLRIVDSQATLIESMKVYLKASENKVDSQAAEIERLKAERDEARKLATVDGDLMPWEK